jgi:CheY-like chemotaxis protein
MVAKSSTRGGGGGGATRRTDRKAGQDAVPKTTAAHGLMVPNRRWVVQAGRPSAGVRTPPAGIRNSHSATDFAMVAALDADGTVARCPTPSRRMPVMPTILLIDDDAAVRSAISLILDQEDHVVSAAPDGEAGLEFARQRRFDLAIVDIFMPGLDGIETISRLHAMAPALPIIATSGAVARDPSGGTSDVLAAAMGKGASLVIHKPFRPRELLQAIAKCLAAGIPGAAAAD